MRRVQVYRNLHKNCWSVRDKKTGKVVGHASRVVLTDCTFKVSEAGRQRVIKEQRKNVHAFVEGFIEDSWLGLGKVCMRSVSYNPYKGAAFYYKDNDENIYDGALTILDKDGKVLVSDIR